METWAPVAITAILNLVLAAFVYGRLTQSVSAQEQRVGALESDSGQIWKKLSDHGERLTAVETQVRMEVR
jgi:FlaG/FlaF family flagellin (archaellin)